MISPDSKHTPEPDCAPFRIIPAVAIQGWLLSFRSAPAEMMGAKSVAARQSANAKRTVPSLADDDAWRFKGCSSMRVMVDFYCASHSPRYCSGPDLDDPTVPSKFDDGRIGICKLATRSQGSLPPLGCRPMEAW